MHLDISYDPQHAQIQPYPLFGAMCRADPVVHDIDVRIAFDRPVVRVRAGDDSRVVRSALDRCFDVTGVETAAIGPTMTAWVHRKTGGDHLSSEYVKRVVSAWLDARSCRRLCVEVGPVSPVVRVRDAVAVGRQVTIRGLEPEAASELVESGIGGRRRFGMFFPC